MSKVPGMGWLASSDPVSSSDAGDASLSYPAPSAAAIPTTISDARQGAALAENTPRFQPGAVAATPPAYPDTMYPAYPSTPPTQLAQGQLAMPNGSPAAAAVPITSPSSSISTANANWNSAAGFIPSNSANLANTELRSGSTDVQQGFYPSASSGTATTWDGPPGSRPNQAIASTLPPYGGNSQPPSDEFVANVAAVSNPSATPGATNAHANFEMPVGATPHVAPAGYAAETFPLTNLGTGQTASSGSSHYANIAAQQLSPVRSGPWRPGSTTDLPRGNNVMASGGTSSSGMPTTPVASMPSTARAGNWD